MRYSLNCRFRGALLGATFGDLLGVVVQQQRQERTAKKISPAVNWLELDAWWMEQPALSPSLPTWGTLITKLSHALIERPCPDWQTFSPLVERHLLRPSSPGKAINLAIATLPLALFYHEDTRKQRSQLARALSTWQAPDLAVELAFALGAVLNQPLQDGEASLDALATLQQDSDLPVLRPLIEQVFQSLTTGHSLGTTLLQFKRMEPHPTDATSVFTFALALYCFLRTPHEFWLSLRTVLGTGLPPRSLGTLMGAIAGCHSPTVGLSPCLLTGEALSALNTLWGVAAPQELMLLADQLVAAWAGVAAPSQPTALAAIAAPQVIRTFGR